MFKATRYLFKDETRTETIAIECHFRTFAGALAWIQDYPGRNAGGSIMDALTWNTLYEIGRDGVHEDYRNK